MDRRSIKLIDYHVTAALNNERATIQLNIVPTIISIETLVKISFTT